ncbi:MAG TPA: chorismate mutase [Edaphobacter sp.]|uniref:chorismate mutase n=1 Tax=Edaphobacter sp. TaxID=1934404 RepID=UPI002BB0A3B7|nr:chorismate mutase [Edaphobacter sp.]HUZ93814.1 chorismate mutase [Edaphobacter sp.]
MSISELRDKLDLVDADLIQLLGQRLKLCLQIADEKLRNGLPMMQPHRVEFVRQRCATLGQQAGLDTAFVKKLYAMIIEEACRCEDEHMHANALASEQSPST